MTLADDARRAALCPAWCGREHAPGDDEPGLHLGTAVMVRGRLVRLCATYDAVTGGWDGPYVLVGAQEYTLGEADLLAQALTALVDLGGASLVAQ